MCDRFTRQKVGYYTMEDNIIRVRGTNNNLLMFRYLGRQKGGYYTREDIGTLGARDPDTAVLNGVTGIQF